MIMDEDEYVRDKNDAVLSNPKRLLCSGLQMGVPLIAAPFVGNSRGVTFHFEDCFQWVTAPFQN